MTCEHDNGFNPCREPAAWIGTLPHLERAFCPRHKEIHASWEGQHFTPLTPELEARRLATIAAQQACPRCTISNPKPESR